MAGVVFFVLPPVLGGLTLAPALQAGLRLVGATVGHRFVVELGLVAAGATWICARGLDGPGGMIKGNAGNGFEGTDWKTFFLATTMVTTGVFAMV